MLRLGRYKSFLPSTDKRHSVLRAARKRDKGQSAENTGCQVSPPLLFTDGLRVQYKRFFWTVLERERARQSGAS